MSSDVVETWLSRIGLEQYAHTFNANAIDFSVLPDLTDQDLEKLGVLLGHRRKLLRAIADLNAFGMNALSVPTALRAVARSGNTAERRQLTIMFCDLVDSTALSTRLDPEDLRDVIAAFHRCCTDLITKVGGFVARHVGDGSLAYFGYPQALEHDAERAVRAGLSLVAALPKLKTAAGVALQVRVGIATGLVVVGDLTGTGATLEHEVIGETPNLAARLQARAEPGTVVISSSTRKLTGGLFDYRDLGVANLKGFAETVPAWQVLGASAADSRFEALRAGTTPLVNRVEEIDLLVRRWERAKVGEGSVVLISGDPGIGKSRIAETLIKQLIGEPHTRLREFCSPHHQDIALHPSVTQLERAAGFRRDDTDDQRLTKLERVLAMAVDDVEEAVPLLASLLSIPTGDRYPALDINPEQRKAATLQALVSQVVGLTRRRPVLLVVEDAQWADPTSLELFELIFKLVSSLPLLAIVTFRPEFVAPWVGRSDVTLISLNRLPRRLCAEMITHVTGGKALPQTISDQINDRTDGVPLFIEELTKAVVESGLIANADYNYETVGSVTPLTIPTSLQESLLARLDRLASTSDVVQIAAALGRQFSHELISAVAGLTPEQVDDALAQLANAELIFRRGVPPDAVYTFKHALVQDTAYGTLLRGRRQQIHARIADTLEKKFPEIVAAQPALLARHSGEAGLSEKAVTYWLKAGQQALERSAMTEAMAQLRKGLDVLDSLPDGPGRRQTELDLQLAFGLALMATKGYSAPEVGRTYARARVLAERAEQIGQPEYLRRLFYGQWIFHRVRGEHKLALSLAEQMIKLGEARDNVTLQLVGRRTSGTTHLFLGNFLVGRTLLEQCLEDPSYRDRQRLSADPQVMMLANLAWILSTMGYIDQARARLNEALLGARRLGHPHTLADVLLVASSVGKVTGSPHMQEHTEELLTLATERSLPLNLGWAMAYRGASFVALERAQEGLSLISRALTEIRATGAVTGTPDLLVMMAEAWGKVGKPGDGFTCLTEAAQIIEATDERWGEAELHRSRGDLLNAAGDLVGAELSYRDAVAVARSQGAKLFELRASIGLARLRCKQRRRAEAHDLLAPTYNWFTEGFDSPDLKAAKVLLDSLG
jgi:class 3 adenylate cyclase/tetratricopeptide (TPR) repeat protein